MRSRLAVLAVSILVLGCQSGASVGATCTRQSECASPLVCAYGRCRAECQQNRDCPAGARCLLVDGVNGACSLDVDSQCETGVGRACASGLVCAADRCEGGCTIDGDCPSDGTCLHLASGEGFCFDTRTGADAGLPPPDAGDDAGHDAAPPIDAGPSPIGAVEACVGTTGGCVIGHDARVYCWGGLAACGTSVATPQHVPGVDHADAIACGDGFACAHSTSDLFVRCWGRSDVGQTGTGTTSACQAPGLVVDATMSSAPLSPPVALAAAGTHACAVDSSPSIRCWGENRQVIDPTMPSSAQLLEQNAAVQGTYLPSLVLSMALAPDGLCVRVENVLGSVPHPVDVDCIGENGHMELSAGNPVAAYWTSAIVAGRTHRCALDFAHHVLCWGDAHLGQLSDPPSASAIGCGADACASTPHVTDASLSFTSIAASGDGDTTCAVLANGSAPNTVACWGANDSAQAGLPTATPVVSLSLPPVVVTLDGTTPLARVRQLAVGPRAACALDDQEALYCWGDTDFDAATAPTPIARPISIPGGQP